MSNAPLILGVSGLRGIAGESLTPEVAVRFARAFGAWVAERNAQASVVVGRDGRAGGRVFADAAIDGLRASGVDVTDIDVAMTPSVAVAVDDQGCDGGLVVTASHNPQEWNGLKCLVGEAGEGEANGRSAAAPAAETAREIVARFEAGSVGDHASRRWGGLEHRDDIAEVHVSEVEQTLYRHLLGDWSRAYGVVLDSVNASGSRAARLLLGGLDCRLQHLNDADSGVFSHAPEPTRENLGDVCAAVGRSGTDIGFAQDPDGDRLAIVDEKGRYIGEEYTLVLAARCLLDVGQARPPVVVANLSTSRMIEDVAEAHGARVVRTPVGEANVVEAMKRLRDGGESVVLGGEGNGGVIWPEVCYVRDSLSAMVLTLSLMARTGKTISELVGEINALSGSPEGYAIEKRKVGIRSTEAAEPAVEAVAKHWSTARLDRQDGVRVDLDDRKAWLHVRASNTEPIMRLIAEATDAGAATDLLDEAQRVIGGK